VYAQALLQELRHAAQRQPVAIISKSNHCDSHFAAALVFTTVNAYSLGDVP
jgi:hypothetical protein